MSLPVEEIACEKENDGDRLPDVVYSNLIKKYFDQASCAAVAQSGLLDGFSPLYNTSRSSKGLLINEQSFYFTPTSWSSFIEQHITLLESITTLNINNLYWLPGDLLLNTILNMPNLEQLSIKGTQVCTICQVVKILHSCQKITKLDFTFTEKTQEELMDNLEKGTHLSVACFKRLTSLKLSVIVREFDGWKDPWLPIMIILSSCRACTDLTVEVTYAGKPRSPFEGTSEQFQAYVFKSSADEWLRTSASKLSWMKGLESLVFVKLGPNATCNSGKRVMSPLLDSLVRGYLFPRLEKNQTPLRRFWIQDFEVYDCPALDDSISDSLQSYRSGDCNGKDEEYESFHNITHLGGSIRVDFSRPLPSLKKLQYASGTSHDDVQFYQFCEAHPGLEDLSVRHRIRAERMNDAVCKLPKLKTFSCERHISKEFVEAMTEAYPIVEDLRLTANRRKTIPPDHTPILSAFRFPHLTFLSLSNFQLLDGAALLPIIKECPKLESVHFDTDALDSESFPSNLELFVTPATKLRDFRLVFKHQEDAYPSTAYSILKALLKGSVLLERVALIDGGSEKRPDWKPPPEYADFLVGFTAKMTHMTCLCLTFNQLDVDFMEEIKNRVKKEVVTERPSLWFSMGRTLPEASDEGVPAIHYHQIINPISFVMPRF